MALLKWDDEEERKRQEEMQGASPIKTIASIQSGAWQPAPSGADAPAVDDEEPQINGGIFDQQQAQPQAQESENYIMSDEKAQVDEQKRQRDIEIENARRAEAARQLAAQQMAAQQQAFKKGQVQTRQGTAIDVDGVKSDTGWKKYYDKAFKKEKGELDFWGRLLDGGQASKRAEVAARTKYQRELQQQPGQEDHARSIGAYNSAMAQDNSNRARALAQGSGALTPNANFGDKVRGTLNTMKNSSIYDSLLGVNDAQKKGIDDPLRFVGNLIQGIPTMPLTGMKEGYEAIRNRGTDELTGLEKELNGAERLGRGVSGALNVVTPFVGGSGKLLDSLTTKVMTNTASAAEKSALKQLTAKILLPAIEQGGIGGAQSGAEYFGQGNTLLDEDGEFDKEKLADFAKQTGTATAMGIGGGLVMGGAGELIRRRRAGTPGQPGDLADLETRATLAREAERGKGQRAEMPGESMRAFERGEVTPVREGFAEPVLEPIAEGRARTEEFAPIRNEAERVPTERLPSEPLPVSGRNNLIDSSANDITPVGRMDAIKNKVSDIKERLRLKDEAGGNAGSSNEPTIINGLTGQEIPNPAYKPVADGTAQVTPAKNIPESNVTPIKSEEVRALQESKAGASQAEEAVINQKLQEAESSRPALKGKDIGSVFDDPEIAKNANDTNTFLKEAKNLRENYPGGDKKFLDDVIYGNVEAKGKVGEFARSVANADATEVGRSYSISDMLDDYMAPLDAPSVSKSNLKDAHLQDLKNQMMKLAKDSDQPELRKQAFSAIKDMDIDGQIDYLASGLKNARDNGVQATLYAKEQFGAQTPKPEARPSVEPKSIPENAKPVKELPQPKFERDLDTGKMKYKTPEKPTPITDKSIPKVDSVPEGMKGDAPKVEKVLSGADIAKQKRKDLANRVMTSTGDAQDVVQRVADATGLSKDGGVDIDTILSDAKIKPEQSKKIKDIHTELEAIFERNKATQKQNRKDYIGEKDVNIDMNKSKFRDTRQARLLEKKLGSELRELARQGSISERAVQTFENITRGRLANMLSSTGNVTRNLPQELMENVIGTIKNPIKSVRGMTGSGNLLKDAGKNALDDWKVTPKNVSEGYSYILGNVYNTAMTPVSAAANARKGALRTEVTQWATKQIEGKNLSISEAQSLSRTLSNHTEALVNTLAGQGNGMVNSRQAAKSLKAWKEFVKTGDKASLLAFEKTVSHQSTLAKKMLEGVFEGNTKGSRVVNGIVSNVFPYVRTAWNLAVTGVDKTLNPLSKSLLDDIRADQRGSFANAGNVLKNKIVDYGLLTGAAVLVNDGLIDYNDGDDPEKPRGITLKVGKDSYVPIRATSIELPLAVTVAVARIAKDVASGDARTPAYYGKIISDSLPYINQFEQTTGAMESLANLGGDEGDGGYAAKSYGVNTAKSFVPWSNNGIQAGAAGAQGKSVDAKKTYDENPIKWLENTLKNSYGMGDDLPVSRDAAGRARTVDNQGILINKKTNDLSTAEFSQRITSLVNYGRKNGLGKGTQDMFNTYDDGKNNNFKTISGQIWGMTGKGGNETKLQKNEKLAGLASQQREGFFGTTGSELLTLDGQNLYSDVSMPNADGTKNSSKPISMQSIKNAIAATDLPEEQRNRMYEISQANQALYSKVESKEWTYDQYKAVKAESEKEYVSILSNSESYKKMNSLFDKLDETGFFKPDGLGSTKSGQTYLWNSLNALLGSKGKTPAADYPKDDKGFTPWGKRGGGGRRGRKGSGFGATNKPGDRGNTGVKWTPVQKRQMAATASGKYTPVNIKVKLGNAVKKDKSQNYADRSF